MNNDSVSGKFVNCKYLALSSSALLVKIHISQYAWNLLSVRSYIPGWVITMWACCIVITWVSSLSVCSISVYIGCGNILDR